MSKTGSEQDAAYRLPELVAAYDALYRDRADFAFHIAAVGAEPIRILDVGCGTGTLAIALAGLGHVVHAVDPSRAMIEAARRKPGAAAVSWHVGQCDGVPVGRSFDRIIMTGHAFQCLLDDSEIAHLFRCVGERLAPGGRFVFETRNPDARAWEGWNPANASPPVPLATGGTVQLIHDVISRVGDFVTYRETFKFQPSDDEVVSIGKLRFSGSETIVGLASKARLSLRGISGDWDRSTTGPELIFEFSLDDNI